MIAANPKIRSPWQNEPQNERQRDSLEWTKTEDGSPTLRDWGKDGGNTGESMHHSAGAFSESLYVYLPALQRFRSLNLTATPSVCVVGLGLGYLELLIAAYFLSKNQNTPPRLRLTSHESRGDLRRAFLEWVLDRQPKAKPTPSVLSNAGEAYEHIQKKMAQHFQLEPNTLRLALKQWSEQGRWELRAALNSTNMRPERHHVILFDAYSSASSPTLWKRSFFDALLAQQAAETCVFATYASRTILKHSLRTHGFCLEKRKGFQGKRECTLAIRTPSPQDSNQS